MAVKKEDVIAYLEKANMMEVSELITEIEEKFGVSASAPVAVAAAPAAGDGWCWRERNLSLMSS